MEKCITHITLVYLYKHYSKHAVQEKYVSPKFMRKNMRYTYNTDTYVRILFKNGLSATQKRYPIMFLYTAT